MVQTPDRQDRARGALLGVHAGDSLGAAVEFCRPEEVRARFPDGLREIVGGGIFDWPAGHATDDTDLTRAVLLAYLAPGDDVVVAAASHMVDWLHGNWPDRQPGSPPKDIGGATQAGLQRYLVTGDPRSSGAGAGNAGNGSLMRCIPTALAIDDPQRRITESMEISAITHDDLRCTSSCAVYNEIVADLLGGATAGDAVEAGLRVAHDLGEPDVVAAVRYGRTMPLAGAARTGQTFLANEGRGFVLDSLTLAVAAVLDERSMDDVLADVVQIGHDTDTNAAIAGGLLGARDGASGIPPSWVRTLQFAGEFVRGADLLVPGEGLVPGHRPV